LRHTFATLAIEREMPLDVARDLLGHASIQTTSIYVKTQHKRLMREAGRVLAGT
jgi:site-specific recombinase XerD